MRESDCVFCEIVGGRAPSYRVLEDVHAVAFSEVSHGHVAAMVHRVAGERRSVSFWLERIDASVNGAVAVLVLASRVFDAWCERRS